MVQECHFWGLNPVPLALNEVALTSELKGCCNRLYVKVELIILPLSQNVQPTSISQVGQYWLTYLS